MTLKDLLANVDELEALAHGGGAQDDRVLLRARALVSALRYSSDEFYYAREKLGGMERWFEILYSAAKFQKYGGGAQQIRAWILVDLATLRGELSRTAHR